MTRADRYRVLLVRSGATEWDEQSYLPGLADLPLCDRERAAFCVDENFVQPGQVCAVISAGDEASVETAGLVSDALGCKHRKCPGLGDVDLGLWQGLRMDELRERTPKVYRQWIDDPLSLHPPEGETLREARERLLDQLVRAVEKSAKASAKNAKVPKTKKKNATPADPAGAQTPKPISNKPTGPRIPTVAVVLRPIALALVRSKLLGDSKLAGWTSHGSAPRFEWHELTESRLDTLRMAPAASA